MSELTPGKEAGDRDPGDEVARSELGEVVVPSRHGYWIVIHGCVILGCTYVSTYLYVSATSLLIVVSVLRRERGGEDRIEMS